MDRDEVTPYVCRRHNVANRRRQAVVYPSTRHGSPTVKSFVEHLQAKMTPPPWELGPMP